ncbi:MAG: energy-coupling factor ABC transporter permease [Chloroflexota bacterium]|nr:PDGLE domain-containing protein [Chloroflexota bacterium]MBI5704796.1 PDGLE domain-containing protein [Chloroflexota bacterium]
MHYAPAPLHIPDGFLNVTVSVICWVITVIVIGVAVSRTNKALGEKQVPLMGIMAAFIFAAQMINFPIAGGTSGHLLGGALAAIVLGPWAGMLVMTAVIAVQGLLFQDGGLLVMGANIFNMGLLTAAIGYGLYRSVMNKSTATKLAVAGVAAWLSVMAGALATALQLWLSGTSSLQAVTITMLSVHALIGIGEALITVAALSFIFRTRPDLLGEGSVSAESGRGWIIAGVVISLIVILLSPLASANPDGLERVATDLGFIDAGQAAPFNIIADYTVPFLGKTPLSTILAGILGAFIVIGIVVATGRTLQKKSS